MYLQHKIKNINFIRHVNLGLKKYIGAVLFLFVAQPMSSAYAEVMLEEVIVTATKRGELSVMDIPIAIKAIDGDVLDDYDLRSIDDIVRLDPSLQISTLGVGDSSLIIRGVSSIGSGTVGVYFDEAVITGVNFKDGGGRTPDIGAYDIGRIEVLKGPQGTLFGASSMTGTVRYVSNKPDASEFDAEVSVSGMRTEYGGPGYNINGMVNIPVVKDELALRFVGWQEERDGFVDHFTGIDGVNHQADANDSNITGGRISARWTPTDQLTITGFGLKQETLVEGPQFFQPELGGTLLPIEVLDGPPFFVGMIAPALDGVIGELNTSLPADYDWDDETTLYGGTLEYDLDFGQITASIANLDRTIYSRSDTSTIAARFGTFDIPTFFGTGQLVRRGSSTLNQNQERENLSAEIRFSSDFDGPFNFVAGFFYEDSSTETELLIFLADSVTGIPGCESFSECAANPEVAISPGAGTGGGVNFSSLNIIETKSFALFAHGDYELTEKFTVGGGIRYFESDQDNRESILQGFAPMGIVSPANGGPVQTTPIPSLDGNVEFDKITFDAGLSYTPAENQLYYFRAASGFRQGGINDVAIATAFGIIAPASFEPDTVLNLEIGTKSSWFDDRLSIAAAYYHMFWDDIWVRGEEPTGSFEFISNAAKAEIDGVELEIHARPADRWYFNFGLNWTNGELTADQTFPPGLLARFAAIGSPPPPSGRDGDTLPRTPEWSFSGAAEYSFPFPLISGADAKLRANFSYIDSATSFFNSEFQGFTEFGDYALLDLNATVNYKNWDCTLYIQNVTDKRAEVDVFSDPGGSINAFTTRPRTFGLTVSWHYD